MAANGFIGSRSSNVSRGSRPLRERPLLSWAAHSDPGCERRHNEDAWRICEDSGLLLLADGMGGYNAGDVASAIAVCEAMESLRAESGLPAAGAERLDAIDRAIGCANATILAAAARRPECLGMLSTLTVAWVDERVVTAGHVGDSRLYLWRDGRLIRVTRDHASASLLTRALGAEPRIDVDVAQFEWLDGDQLLLCSDGLTDFVDDRRIGECLACHRAPQASVQALIAAALANGGHDNVTAITACLSRDR